MNIADRWRAFLRRLGITPSHEIVWDHDGRRIHAMDTVTGELHVLKEAEDPDAWKNLEPAEDGSQGYRMSREIGRPTMVDPPIFRILIERFPWGERRAQEKTGAAFQAMVFAFIRADSPHLQVETRKVRTGSARLQGIGDIDTWEGKRLTISAEVKHFDFGMGDLKEFEQFVHKVRTRGALGMVVATGFAEGVREAVVDAGLAPVSIQDLARIVSLWDPVKQRAALNAFEWAIVQKEQSTGLIERFDEFLVNVGYRVAPTAPEEAVADEEDGVAGGTP